MKYYVGKGTEFKKEECKEYKTLDGAVKARDKGDGLNIWNENGELLGEAADEPQTATEDEKQDETQNESSENENGENGANNEQDGEEKEPETIIPESYTTATVVCGGALNIRRSCEWGNDNICGRAVAGQTYIVKAIHTVDGKKLVETIDGLYISGAPEHVKIESV